jgi:asparagine synthase (glutamine-hydrolysing)
MCGISGAIGPRPSPHLLGAIHNVVQAQFSRGPDNRNVQVIETGLWTAVLGHNRLSIIDLNQTANQPMWDHSRRYCIVYNGEIYNYLELRQELESLGHLFATRSDTEVILESFKRWRTGSFSRFNGMFAFAILDCKDRRVWLVRDRFGVKPIYYRLTPSELAFASMMSPIARELGLKPNLAYCARGLHYFIYDCGDDTSAFEGLHAVSPGHYLELDLAGPRLRADIHSYYDILERVRQTRREIEGKAEPELVRQVHDLLADAVRLRLRSDVPLAISLSGGLDSSTIASFLRELHPHVTAFSFGHPSARESEGPLAKVLAKSLRLDTEYVWPTAKEVTESFRETLRSQDAPFSGGSIIAQHHVYAAARKRGFKVVLGGQGGDEAFMGYRKYQLFHLQRLVRQKKAFAAAAFALSLLPTILSENAALPHYWPHLTRYLGKRGFRSAVQLPTMPIQLHAETDKYEWVRQSRDVMELSLPTLLRYEDRNSMAHSIESRLPFMDYRVVELGIALSTSMKLRNGYGKWIVRAAMAGRVPDEIRLARFKKGFKVDEERWIREGLGNLLREELRRIWPSVRECVRPEFRADGACGAFSDTRLTCTSNAFAEAVTLIWLGNRC